MSKKRDDGRFAAERRRKRKAILIILPIVIAAVAAGAAVAVFYKPVAALAINGVECNSGEMQEYHFHSHLSVFVNGREQQVPGSIGIISTPHSCFYWLHTHTTDGIIHMEAPSPMTFTLRQFMEIWRQTKSDSQAFFSTISGMPVKAYVDGNEFNGDPGGIRLQSQEQIVLIYGSAPATIPNYDSRGLK